jgi:Sec-independent protein translocase protein TatA
MFGISIFEFFVILLVALVLVRPSDVPAIINKYKKYAKKFFTIKTKATDYMVDLHNKIIKINENGKSLHTYVIGDNGEFSKAYDIKEIKNTYIKNRKPNKKAAKRNNS